MMNQRTCSHRISEIYAEIILKDRFKQEFYIQESSYYSNLFITVFRNHNFKSKILIIDKESQNILFENILGNDFILYDNIKKDNYLFSFNLVTSSIFKFNNPILSRGVINDSIQIHHNFIIYCKSILDLMIKDDVIYLVGEIRHHYSLDLNRSSNIDKIDFTKFNDEYPETIFILVGIRVNNLEILNGQFFSGGNSFKIWNKNLNQRNCILVEYYNDEYQEYQSYLINYQNQLVKPIHPSFLTKVSDNYLVLTPFTESTHYGRYEEFNLIRLSDCNCFDLYSVLPDLYKELMKSGNIITDEVEFLSNDTLIIGDYEFSCQNLFSGKITPSLKTRESPSFKSLIPIKGNYFDGYALEIHTIKSTLKEDGSFDTLRTDLGELMYKLKYNFDTSAIDIIAQRCAKTIIDIFPIIDIIIPSPPSNLNRPFQPVYELSVRISELIKIPVDIDFIKKLPTEQIKMLSDKEARNIVLERAITIKGKKYEGKDILLFDDLFRSGDTLNAIAKKLIREGCVNSIKALCVTKTRTKK